jgi:pimeloyl-ACP methyl ester carboxylesterase
MDTTEAAAPASETIRPFRVNFSDAELTELRKRISATSQGPQLATMQKLARYWATEYDWRKVEARLNGLPNFVTEIDGLDIHFIHVRSKHENALPLIVTHGWPGSIIEQLKIVDPLTNPTAHGARASEAFDLVIPSMPGYGFSGKPTTIGWDPARTARAWVVLMKRLGYTKFVAQGGDWGAIITDVMAAQGHPELIGIHSNMPGVFPPDIDKAALTGAPAPSGLSVDERLAYEQLVLEYAKGIGYGYQMGLRPQAIYGVADSPVGIAGYFLDHDARSLAMISRVFDGEPEGLTRDDVLDNVTLTWLTNDFGCAPVLGGVREQDFFLRSQRRRHSGRRERLPGRAVPGSAELGGARVSQTHPLQQTRQRRAFRGLGAAEALFRRSSRRLQVAAREGLKMNGKARAVPRGGDSPPLVKDFAGL